MNGPSGRSQSPYAGTRPQVSGGVVVGGAYVGGRTQAPNPPGYTMTLGGAQQAGQTAAAPNETIKVTNQMLDDMRISMVLVLTVQPVLTIFALCGMMVTDSWYVQLPIVIMTMCYSALTMSILNTRWRTFLAKIMVLN